MNELIRKTLEAALTGEISLEIKTKGSKCLLKKGKIVYVVKEVTLELQMPKAQLR